MTLRMYHNPRCSKSRATLALLREAGEEPEIIEYLKTPPDPNELDMLCKKLGLHPRQLFKEDRAKELGLKASDERPRAEWLRLLADNPVLIERPIVVKGDQARLGRPPEAVKALL
ncbi:MAG: arsenate reductase (glutaredoxin) [Burkholderiales bacterium]